MKNSASRWTGTPHVWVAFVTSLGFCNVAPGQETLSVETATKSVTIGRGSAPVIDGRLDEPDWQSAALVDDLHQIQPIEYASGHDITAVQDQVDPGKRDSHIIPQLANRTR